MQRLVGYLSVCHPFFLSIRTDLFCYSKIRHPITLFHRSEKRKFRAENSFVEVGLLLLPHPEPDV